MSHHHPNTDSPKRRPRHFTTKPSISISLSDTNGTHQSGVTTQSNYYNGTKKSQENADDKEDILLTPDPIRRRNFSLDASETRTDAFTGSKNRRKHRKMNTESSSEAHHLSENRRQHVTAAAGEEYGTTVTERFLQYLERYSTTLFMRLSFNMLLMVGNLLIIIWICCLMACYLGETFAASLEGDSATTNSIQQFLAFLLHFSKYLLSSSTVNLIRVHSYVLNYYAPYLIISFLDIAGVVACWLHKRLSRLIFIVVCFFSVVYLFILRFVLNIQVDLSEGNFNTQDAWIVLIGPVYGIGILLLALNGMHLMYGYYEKTVLGRMKKRY